MQVVPVEEPQRYGVVVGVTEQPAPASGVVVGVLTEQPGGRGSVESLGRWKEKRSDSAMPIKLRAVEDTETMVRVGFGKLVDELVQNGASGGILAVRGGSPGWCNVSWSASPDDTSYQRHGSVDGTASTKHGNVRFADFEGVVDDLGSENRMAVYRVTLPSGGLDRWKWAGRPPPPAPADLYTGPRGDGLLSTEEISGDYSAPCICGGDPPFPIFCNSMTVVPLGADTIETWRTGCCFLPPLMIAPIAQGWVWTRKPGTNAFLNGQRAAPMHFSTTFSADGTARATQRCGSFKKRPGSQKRAFQKVETRDLAGKWCGLGFVPFVPYWPFSHIKCTTKRALDEDRYAESGLACVLCLPIPISATRTRQYVNGHPTNGFAGGSLNDNDPNLVDQWHRDPGCAAGCAGLPFSDEVGPWPFFAKKVG
mmetsp:Transcript_7462/g.19549  ORF Transcript_7462/g.19549 Transcript_7462/m.19549 type:complete len:423 (+) Transcript_7462:1150-2418(+)